MPKLQLNGSPGEVYTNDTGKILYQFHCQFGHSCGVCISYHMAIGTSFPIPLHRGCNCTQTPIFPGQSGEPFVDFREMIREMDPSEQAAVMGRSNLQLVESGVVKYEDVVTKTRVRDLREVVSRGKLTVEEMVDAGVGRRQAERAYETVHTPAHELADAKRRELIDALRGKGIADDAIRRAVSERIALRIGIGEGPSGEGGLSIFPTTPKPAGPVEPEKPKPPPKAPKKPAKPKPPPKPAPAPKPKPEPKPKAPAKSKYADVPPTVEGLRSLVTDPKTGKLVEFQEQFKRIGDYLRSLEAAGASPVKVHGMVDAEEMRSLTWGGITFRYDSIDQALRRDASGKVIEVRANRGTVTETFHSLVMKNAEIPEELKRHTREIVLTRQRNKDDAMWEKEYGIADFKSGATGGDGTIVIYNGVGANAVTIGHEMGHNMALGRYGDVMPPIESEFRGASRTGEQAISTYAEKSHAEDFAESVTAYVNGREKFRELAPERYKVIDRMMREAAYGG